MMELITKNSPHLRRPTARVSRMMGDVAIALSPLVVFALWQHGLSALFILLAAVISMVGTEYIYYQIRDLMNKEKFCLKNKSFTLRNNSVLVSGLIYGLIIPDATPITIVIIGGAFAVFFVKLVFGGMGQNIFNIAAFGRVFIALAYGALVASSNYLPEIDGVAGATILGSWAEDPFLVNPDFSIWGNMFTGIGVPGAIGETSVLLILVGAIYLFVRKSFDVFIPITYIATMFVLSLAVMLYKDLTFAYPLTHLFAGGLMFGAVFMATDPITSPHTRPGRIYFAFGLGVLTFVIRVFGSLPEGVAFAILLMNMFVPAIDYPKWSKSRFTLKSVAIFSGIVLVTIFAVLVGVNYVG